MHVHMECVGQTVLCGVVQISGESLALLLSLPNQQLTGRQCEASGLPLCKNDFSGKVFLG